MEEQIYRNRQRLEVSSPYNWSGGLDGEHRTGWQLLWEFDDDQQAAYQGLVEELNRINTPVQLRIVGNSV